MRVQPWVPGNESDVGPWMRDLWERNPRSAAKEITQYLVLYIAAKKFSGYGDFDSHAESVLRFLEKHRDETTGFIGGGANVDLGWAMRGHRNIYEMFYWEMGVPDPCPGRALDATLACQRDDGHFHDGGMCANMDAVQLLAEYGLQLPERIPEVIASIRRCVRRFWKDLGDPSGGFHFQNPAGKVRDDQRNMLTNGLCFVLMTLRYWQSVDPEANEIIDELA